MPARKSKKWNAAEREVRGQMVDRGNFAQSCGLAAAGRADRGRGVLGSGDVLSMSPVVPAASNFLTHPLHPPKFYKAPSPLY